jgi:hypothetical protein
LMGLDLLIERYEHLAKSAVTPEGAHYWTEQANRTKNLRDNLTSARGITVEPLTSNDAS